ncbi:N-acetylmuramoyl-L-alanine amidase LytC precursor [Clostridium liquoris]|jgi:N-acetylmuramoyl-L-alanine amidase|uniref:N-acetylmuramoyl-L-alanine amidase LytC n=1 Tax=Clostridium liquoris TaxID=1289519 RepID=A0A2T0B0L0_9CLOT|nr:cell wall-binding repeat-containing protein [Clostridium liquoris]PRR77101.1 N-acetylmuramoyl-L-alanine amidase LytC precursor [Clostridium liquoris]
MKKRLMIFFCCFVSILFLYKPNVSAAPAVQRLGGNDRYGTSIKISHDNWEKSDNIILVSGENFPDALSAAPLSKKYDAPILLTSQNTISKNLLDEIKRLGAKNAFIIGGTGVISEDIEKQLKNNSIAYTRIYGHDRYETSVNVAKMIGTNNGAFIASGENFPDAISAAPIAALKEMPILLTTKNSIPDVVKDFINNNANTGSKYYVVGESGSISEDAVSGISNHSRLGGHDRYGTNLAVVNEFNLSFDNTYLANGQAFPDALSGSAAAAKTSSPIILVNNSYDVKNSIIQSNLNNISTISVLGGTGVISDTLVQKIINGGSSSSIKVCLDPGHGGYDPGAIGPTGVQEKNVTLAIALKTGEILKKNGIDVVYTRTSDKVSWPSVEIQDLQKRCDIANSENVDYFVSIHNNSFESSSANGQETYYASGSATGKKLAESIQREITKATNLYNRGIKTADFYVLLHTNAPAVLVEDGFISNPNEEKLLNSDSFQNTLAQAIATGIIKFVNAQ